MTASGLLQRIRWHSPRCQACSVSPPSLSQHPHRCAPRPPPAAADEPSRVAWQIESFSQRCEFHCCSCAGGQQHQRTWHVPHCPCVAARSTLQTALRSPGPCARAAAMRSTWARTFSIPVGQKQAWQRSRPTLHGGRRKCLPPQRMPWWGKGEGGRQPPAVLRSPLLAGGRRGGAWPGVRALLQGAGGASSCRSPRQRTGTLAA